jgi:tetratricopeptide (TPR) repeat protein
MVWIIVVFVLAVLLLLMLLRRQKLTSTRFESDLENAKEDEASIISRCLRVLESEPKNMGALIELGRAYHASGKSDLALQTFQKSLNIEEDSSEAHAGLGLVLRTQNRGDEARKSFERALSLNPNNAMAHYGLGLIQYERNEYDQALGSIRTALKIDRNVVPEREAHQILESLEYIESHKEKKETPGEQG